MSTYLIGDVHGCYDELIALLAQVEFDPRRDTLWLTGDLVARGPGSLEVLRYVKSLGDSVRLVLGNHDLHLLAVFAGISRNKPKDRLKPLLEAPDADELLNWLRRQPLLQVDEEKKLVMAHAGITPQWDLETAQQCARDVEAVLSSDSYPFFLDAMYGDMPNHWSNELSGLARLRFISNAFTRMRYCFPNGQLDMYSKEAPEDAPGAAEAVVCHSRPGQQCLQHCLWPLGFAGGTRHAGGDLRPGYRLLLGRGTHLPALGR